MPQFSVIIPSYNRSAFVKDAIESVLRQSYRQFEVIVVDDGSTDDTEEALKPYRDQIIFLTQQNRGPSAARNLGAYHAQGAYLAFLDSDDTWFESTLQTYHDITIEHVPTLILGAATHDPVVTRCKEPYQASGFKYFPDYLAACEHVSFVSASIIVVRRREFHLIGGFDESLSAAEDHDLVLRLAEFPGFVKIEQPPTVWYRRHVGNISQSVQDAAGAAERLLAKEAAGELAGGVSRRVARWTILSRILRPVCVACVRSGHFGIGWHLFICTFLMNLKLMRFRFLFGYPFYLALGIAFGSSLGRRGQFLRRLASFR
jgi:glycosyltransferase involved in cell wall biosynthesis